MKKKVSEEIEYGRSVRSRGRSIRLRTVASSGFDRCRMVTEPGVRSRKNV